MTGVDATPAEIPAAAEDVARCCSASRWSVEDQAWKQLQPELPDEVTALLANPVVVCADSVRPAGAHRARAGSDGHRSDPPVHQPESAESGAAAQHQASTLEPWSAWPSRAWPVLMAHVDQSLRFLAPAPPHRNTGRHSARC